MQFIPTSSSWLNLAERWFRELTDKRIRRGVFRSVPELVQAIEAYVEHHNDNAKGFVWTAKAYQILAKVRRARSSLTASGLTPAPLQVRNSRRGGPLRQPSCTTL